MYNVGIIVKEKMTKLPALLFCAFFLLFFISVTHCMKRGAISYSAVTIETQTLQWQSDTASWKGGWQ